MSRTKAEILAGAKELFDTVEVTDDWAPRVHSLTDGQFARVQARMLAGQKMSVDPADPEASGTVELDLGILIDNEFSSRVLAIVFGIDTGERWSEIEVRSIPIKDAVKTISDCIFDLGGHDLMAGLQPEVKTRVRTFRRNRRRPGDPDAAYGGISAGDEPAGDDNDSEDIHRGGDEGDGKEEAGPTDGSTTDGSTREAEAS